jgi:hypothetical protein
MQGYVEEITLYKGMVRRVFLALLCHLARNFVGTSLNNCQEMDLVQSFLRYFVKGQKVKFIPFCTQGPFSQKLFCNFFLFLSWSFHMSVLVISQKMDLIE